MQDNLIKDNKGTAIRIIVGGYEVAGWDEASFDSAIDIPADAFSVTLFDPVYDHLPETVAAGKTFQAYYGKELVMTGVVDRIAEAIGRKGRGLQISGRDLVGQLIDCSVPVFSGRQVTLEVLLNKYVKSGDLGSLFKNIELQNNAWLKNNISVEPGESLWDSIVKAAQVTGQHVWLKADGTLVIGDPFKSAKQLQTTLSLMFDGDDNNMLDAQYDEDVSGVFSQIQVLSQGADAQSILAESKSTTPYGYNRLKIVSLGDIETKSEADTAIKKIKADNDLEAYSLTTNVVGWLVDGKVWQTGCYINLQSDVLSRATAKWAIMGRTLTLSRDSGQITKLKLKRQGDWAQPLINKEKPSKASMKKKKKDKAAKTVEKNQTSGAKK
jgi:prophage tail gpP-like protein